MRTNRDIREEDRCPRCDGEGWFEIIGSCRWCNGTGQRSYYDKECERLKQESGNGTI